MAAGLGFKTFTTGEVLTAADTNGYLMQGVNVFANAAARTAAITSPQEGQMSYLKDTNSTEYYSGAAWVAVGAAGGGITLLSTTALSGTSTTVSSISQDYTDLYIFINSLSFNVAAELNFTFNAITNYYTARSSNAAWTADNASSKIRTSISSVSFGGTVIRIPQYAVAAYHGGQMQSFDFNNGANLFNAFSINSSSALNSFTVTSAAGTSTMSGGNIYIYGVK